jgi:6-pyruvoyltetrahydropterin/6-carboxytetrahydropterin synthase
MKIELKGLGFSAAHFVIGHKKCEFLHGHNWRVGVAVDGEEDERGLVVDFIELKKIMEEICCVYDHRLLLPTKNMTLKRISGGKSTKILVRGRRFEFPSDSVVWVPVVNITVEELARVIADRIAKRLQKYRNVSKITVTVDESEGEGAEEARWLRGQRR